MVRSISLIYTRSVVCLQSEFLSDRIYGYFVRILYPVRCTRFVPQSVLYTDRRPKRHELLARADSKMCARLNMLGKSEVAPAEGVSEARADHGTPEYHGVSRTLVMQMSTGMSCGT